MGEDGNCRTRMSACAVVHTAVLYKLDSVRTFTSLCGGIVKAFRCSRIASLKWILISGSVLIVIVDLRMMCCAMVLNSLLCELYVPTYFKSNVNKYSFERFSFLVL